MITNRITFTIENGKLYNSHLEIYLEPHHLGFPSNGIYYFITCDKTKESEEYGNLDDIEIALDNALRTEVYINGLSDVEYSRQLSYIRGTPRITYLGESHDIYGFHNRSKFGSLLKETL